ncbi:Hypothetical predicted protein [Mytilus galloprovincialis]|nr:Hypothetical predicted protein [Mytilus galloprovincialis]
MANSSWKRITAPSIYYDETAYWKNECSAKCFNKIQQINSKNKDLYDQNQVLKKESDRRIQNIKEACDSKLLLRISSSIKEQNSLWLKCIAVKPGRPCDVTQGCSTSKQGLCFPINV